MNTVLDSELRTKILKSVMNKFKKLPLWRKFARILFQILLAVGFIVQSVKFVEMYLEYPSSVALEVLQPSELELPAFTICNVNEIRSTPYCEKYPQYCGNQQSDQSFCTRYAEYCNHINDSRVVPLRETYSFRHLSRYEQQTLGHQYSTFIASCIIETDEVERNCSSNPILVPALSFSNEVPFNCFMLYSLFNKPFDTPEKIPVSTKITLELDVELSEYHPSHLSRGAQLMIHSPYHVPSPVNEGLFLNMGKVYRIYVDIVGGNERKYTALIGSLPSFVGFVVLLTGLLKSKKHLLQLPYKSRCSDYETKWRENNGSGPVTAKMCKEKCKLEKSLELYGCAERRIDYPHNETICSEPIPNFASETRFECAKGCSSPCRMKKYDVQVQVANSDGDRKRCLKTLDKSCATYVHIFFDNLQITTFSYTPRFEPIGILSFIGGYVGLWLGISLLTVYDFLEKRIFFVISLIRKKWKLQKHSTNHIPNYNTNASTAINIDVENASTQFTSLCSNSCNHH